MNTFLLTIVFMLQLIDTIASLNLHIYNYYGLYRGELNENL